MGKRVTAWGKVEDGVLRILHRKQFDEAVRVFKGDVRVVVEKQTRTSAQNDLMWVWNTMLGKEIGLDPEDVHEINKDFCNQKHVSWVNKNTGELNDRSVPGSTRVLPIDDFSELLERIQRFWAEQGYDLPWPEELK